MLAMPALTRRHLLAGAAATAACAAMPAAAAIAAQAPDGEPITPEFLEEAQIEASHRISLAWSQAVKQAWELSMGPVDEEFAELYAEEYRTLQTDDCSKAHAALVALFSEDARNRMPQRFPSFTI
jgi:hypothetical protein